MCAYMNETRRGMINPESKGKLGKTGAVLGKGLKFLGSCMAEGLRSEPSRPQRVNRYVR